MRWHLSLWCAVFGQKRCAGLCDEAGAAYFGVEFGQEVRKQSGLRRCFSRRTFTFKAEEITHACFPPALRSIYGRKHLFSYPPSPPHARGDPLPPTSASAVGQGMTPSSLASRLPADSAVPVMILRSAVDATPSTFMCSTTPLQPRVLRFHLLQHQCTSPISQGEGASLTIFRTVCSPEFLSRDSLTCPSRCVG